MEQLYTDKNKKGDVWFIYDGDCPICQIAARGLRIQKAVGELNLINARDAASHAIIKEVSDRGLDLDEGMVIKFRDMYYHGADALQIMALLGTNQGWFNRMNYLLFRSPLLSRLCYPSMRAARNLALRLKGITKIHNISQGDKPMFQPIFGKDWENLPPVIHKHYANHPFSKDKVTIDGKLDVMCKWYLQPLLAFLGSIPPYNETNVPITVRFTSQPDDVGIGFERLFQFKHHPPFRFISSLYLVKGNKVEERMRYGVVWRCRYGWDGNRVTLTHSGYALRVLGKVIPVPITWLVGRVDAFEIPLSDDTFSMSVAITHPVLGKIYGYEGEFRVVENQ